MKRIRRKIVQIKKSRGRPNKSLGQNTRKDSALNFCIKHYNFDIGLAVSVSGEFASTLKFKLSCSANILHES